MSFLSTVGRDFETLEMVDNLYADVRESRMSTTPKIRPQAKSVSSTINLCWNLNQAGVPV